MLILRLAAILIVFLSILSFEPKPGKTSTSNRAGVTFEEPLPEFPPGATVIFDDAPFTANERVPINGVFLKRIETNSDQTVWTVSSGEVSLGAAQNSAASKSAIAFVVPQLPRGSYEAWYESKADNRKVSSLKFKIVPRLLAEEGIVRSDPGKEVEVRVRIPLPKVGKRDGGAAELNVPARLTSRHPNVAEVLTNSPQKIGNDGSVTWKVRIVSSGIAEVEATADGFEPAILNVVGMPGPGATYQEAQMELLKEELKDSQESAQNAEARSKRFEIEIARREEALSPGAKTGAAAAGIDRLEKKMATADADVEKFNQRSSEAMVFMNELSSPYLARVDETALKPGDVLLVLGSSPIISSAIQSFDGQQLGVTGEYSHASLYVGKINGQKMVAEMWSSGYWITPLRVSTKEARIVDVYRRYDIDDTKRDEIANKGQTIFGNPQNFIRDKSPWFLSWGSGLPYAYEEIQVLGLAALGTPASLVRSYVISRVDRPAGGRRKMICSELVACVYQDVGLPLTVQYWRALNDAGIFDSDDRRLDYTTPNMIARSSNLMRVGRFLGP
jgi:hypothetical protein